MHLNVAVEVRPAQGYGLNLDAAEPALAANPSTPVYVLEWPTSTWSTAAEEK